MTIKMTRKDRIVYELDGRPHRENGPAIIWNNGILEWWIHGMTSRLDGPAVVWPYSGIRDYYIGGKWFSEGNYVKYLLRYHSKEISFKNLLNPEGS